MKLGTVQALPAPRIDTAELWSTNLEVGAPNNRAGCNDSFTIDPCSSRLTSPTFTLGGTTYRIKVLIKDSATGPLFFALDQAFPSTSAHWVLSIGGTEFPLADADPTGTTGQIKWTGNKVAGLSLPVNSNVTVKLLEPTVVFETCPKPISLGMTDAGRWDASCFSVSLPGSYAQFYAYTPEKNGSMAATATSPDAVETLYLWEDGKQIDRAFSTGKQSARIHYSGVKAGKTYTIEVATRSPGKTGRYQLSLEGEDYGFDDEDSEDTSTVGKAPPAECLQTVTLVRGPPHHIRFGKQVTGTLGWPCSSMDQAGSYARYFTFTLKPEDMDKDKNQLEKGMLMEVTSSFLGSAKMYLRNGTAGSGDHLAKSFSPAQLGPVRTKMWAQLPAGTYTVEVHDAPGVGGSFYLTIKEAPKPSDYPDPSADPPDPAPVGLPGFGGLPRF